MTLFYSWWKKHRDSSEKPADSSETTPAKRKRPRPGTRRLVSSLILLSDSPLISLLFSVAQVKTDDTKPTESSEEQKKGRYILFIGEYVAL